jgi:hypothetical protein
MCRWGDQAPQDGGTAYCMPMCDYCLPEEGGEVGVFSFHGASVISKEGIDLP